VSISYIEWWVVYFGFQLHLAWVTHQFLMAFNIIVWAYGCAMEAHIAAAVVTVCGLVLSSFFFVYTRRDVVHAWVVSFMLYYMGQNMVDPSAMIPFAVLTSAEGDPAVYSVSVVATGLSMGYYSLSGICFVFGFWALTLVT
jgi:predicted permease